MKRKILTARPLTKAAYRRYGDVIEAGGRSLSANGGTARRFNHLAGLKRVGSRTKPNLCLYRCRPARMPLTIKLLEKHPLSTQVFIPMGAAKRYLVVVALGGKRPDLSTLRAFTVSGRQGITYRPGVWHHPMVALDRVTDLACLIWEDGSRNDCVLAPLEPAERVSVRLVR